MNSKEKKPVMTEEDIMKLLDYLILLIRDYMENKVVYSKILIK